MYTTQITHPLLGPMMVTFTDATGAELKPFDWNHLPTFVQSKITRYALYCEKRPIHLTVVGKLSGSIAIITDLLENDPGFEDFVMQARQAMLNSLLKYLSFGMNADVQVRLRSPLKSTSPIGSYPFGMFGPDGTRSNIRQVEMTYDLMRVVKNFASRYPLEEFVKKWKQNARCFCGQPDCGLQAQIDAEKHRQGLS